MPQHTATVSSPPHPGPIRDPDIKGRWSETMKLQVRCQLPFETKHSPNPGKTQRVPGIRTNKMELKGEWQRGEVGWGEWRRRFYGPCWQYGISIKGPNSALNYPPCATLLTLYVCTVCLCEGNRWRKDWLQVKICVYTIVFTHTEFSKSNTFLLNYIPGLAHPPFSPTPNANFSV